MIGVPNTKTLSYTMCVMRTVPATSGAAEITDIFRNHYRDIRIQGLTRDSK